MDGKQCRRQWDSQWELTSTSWRSFWPPAVLLLLLLPVPLWSTRDSSGLQSTPATMMWALSGTITMAGTTRSLKLHLLSRRLEVAAKSYQLQLENNLSEDRSHCILFYSQLLKTFLFIWRPHINVLPALRSLHSQYLQVGGASASCSLFCQLHVRASFIRLLSAGSHQYINRQGI